MKKKKMSGRGLAKISGISTARGQEAVIKAQMISAVLKTVEKHGYTHAELARRSGLPRSAVTGILFGSLQKVTIRQVLSLVAAANLDVEMQLKKIA